MYKTCCILNLLYPRVMWSVCMCCSAPEAIKTWSAVQREIFFEKRPSVSLHLFPNELNRYLDFELKGHLNTSQGKWTFAKCFWLNGLRGKKSFKCIYKREIGKTYLLIDQTLQSLADFSWLSSTMNIHSIICTMCYKHWG